MFEQKPVWSYTLNFNTYNLSQQIFFKKSLFNCRSDLFFKWGKAYILKYTLVCIFFYLSLTAAISLFHCIFFCKVDVYLSATNLIYYMSLTQNLRQISSECNFLSSNSSPVPEPNKPNQMFLQALNKGHVPQREKTFNSERIFKIVLLVYLRFFQLCPSFRSIVNQTVTPTN